jgi:peptide/nickel transport system substrate-binding protein
MSDSNYWSRFAGRRLSRRTLVTRGAVVGTGVAGIVLVGCSSSNNNNKSNAATQAATQAAATTVRPAGTAVAATAPTGTARPSGSPSSSSGGAGGPIVNGTYGKSSGKVQQLTPPKTMGGVWRQFSYNSLPTDSYDPHLTTFGPMSDIHSMVFSRVVAYDDPINQSLTPDLAATIPEQPDKLTYIIKVNPAAKWQSKVPIAGSNNPIAGQPVTAGDIKYSLQRQVNPQSPKAGAFYRALNWLTIDKMDQPDDQTLRITTKSPMAPFLHFLADEFSYIISQKIVDQAKDEIGSPNLLIGSGPFVLNSFEALKQVRVDKNPDWFLKDAGFAKGRPFIDSILQTFQPQDDNSIEGAFKGKQIDLTGWNDQNNADRVSKAAPGSNVYQYAITGSIVTGLGVGYGPFKDQRLRNAVLIAWDRNALGQAVYQGFFKFSGPVGWLMDRWALPQDQLLKKPGYRYANQADRDADIKMAKQLFDAAGGQSPFPGDSVIWYPNTPAYIPAYFPQQQKNLKDALGLTLQGKEDTTGYTLVVPQLIQHKVDYYFGYDNGAIDLDGWVYTNRTGHPSNFFQVSDPDLDAALDKQRGEFDFAARQKLGYDIQNTILDKGYPTGRANNAVINNTQWNYVKNNYSTPWYGHSHLAANVWLDQSDPSWQGRPS